jgi:hypothetical protein
MKNSMTCAMIDGLEIRLQLNAASPEKTSFNLAYSIFDFDVQESPA